MTIASACNRDLRQNRMEAKTIASEPLHGWRLNTNHSHVSLEWLQWEDSKLHRIQHAGNEDEFRIPKLLTQFTNFTDVFTMDVENAIRTGVKFTVVSKIEAWKKNTTKNHGSRKRWLPSQTNVGMSMG